MVNFFVTVTKNFCNTHNLNSQRNNTNAKCLSLFERRVRKSFDMASMILSDLLTKFEVVLSFKNVSGSIYERLKYSSVLEEKVLLPSHCRSRCDEKLLNYKQNFTKQFVNRTKFCRTITLQRLL